MFASMCVLRSSSCCHGNGCTCTWIGMCVERVAVKFHLGTMSRFSLAVQYLNLNKKSEANTIAQV